MVLGSALPKQHVLEARNYKFKFKLTLSTQTQPPHHPSASKGELLIFLYMLMQGTHQK